MDIRDGQTGGNAKRFLVIDCEFNQLNYPFMIGETFVNPPAYAKTKIVWVDPMDWPEIN